MVKNLYYAKINLNSHIFEVYEGKKDLQDIGSLIMKRLKEDVEYSREDLLFTDDNGNKIKYKAKYKLNYRNKNISFNCIVGSIIKKSEILSNYINEETGEIKKIPVPNMEIIKFFYDINNEIVCFSKTRRFGYDEFCKAFENILNTCMECHEESYMFNVDILREGIDINSIKDSLSNMKNIQSLEIKITPPNPDSDLLREIQNNSEEVLESMKFGNITSKSILFTSKAPTGLNIESKEIQDSISMAEELHSKLSIEESTKKNYIEIDAKDKIGRNFSTKDTKPTTSYISKKTTGDHEFASFCKSMIRSILINSTRR